MKDAILNADWVLFMVPIYWLPVIGLAAFILAFFFARVTGHKKQDKLYRLRSQGVVKGLVNEQIAPMIKGFPGTPSDARFIGKPIDYIVFEGLSSGKVDEIVFVEVKSRASGKLTASERSVRQAVKDKRVRWVKYTLEQSE